MVALANETKVQLDDLETQLSQATEEVAESTAMHAREVSKLRADSPAQHLGPAAQNSYERLQDTLQQLDQFGEAGTPLKESSMATF